VVRWQFVGDCDSECELWIGEVAGSKLSGKNCYFVTPTLCYYVTSMIII
jgi:hypothetical protein